MKSRIRRRRRRVVILGVATVVVMMVVVFSYLMIVSVPIETIRVSGAWALYPMMVRWGEEYEARNPGLRVDISGGGAGQGMTDVLNKLTDIGMVSRDIYPEEIANGAFWVGATKDAVVVTVNSNNPVLDELKDHGITVEQFIGIWITGNYSTWGEILDSENGENIHLLTRADACGAAQTWAKYLGYYQDDLLGTEIVGDPGVASEVARDRRALGYNNMNYAYDMETGEPVSGIAIVPIDINGDRAIDDDEDFYQNKSALIEAIQIGAYPSPPARDLNLVTKGTPDGIVKDFLIWILTDGQQYISEVGYVPLPQSKLDLELSKLGV